MRFLKNRRIVLAIGGTLALLAGLGVAFLIMARDHGAKGPPPASKGGLVVEMGAVDEGAAASARQLRCFVGGQFVGMASLAQCAKKNGVSTQGLDVGLDANGVLTAADRAGVVITPLSAAPAQAPVTQATEPDLAAKTDLPAPAKPVVGACLRNVGTEWRKVGDDMDIATCAKTLFDGKCEKPGVVAYGRWSDQTLRLTAGKLELSSDNKSFHAYAEQVMPSCHLP